MSGTCYSDLPRATEIPKAVVIPPSGNFEDNEGKWSSFHIYLRNVRSGRVKSIEGLPSTGHCVRKQEFQVLHGHQISGLDSNSGDDSTRIRNATAVPRDVVTYEHLTYFIPSTSYGYTAGAYYRNNGKGAVGNLVLGGYDQSRARWANGVSVELPIDHSNSIVLTVESMIYGFEQRNIWSGNVYYILSSKRFLVTIDYTRPYLWLPDDICDNFERFFGLTYNETSNQYMINATAHHDNKQRNATVTLKMGSGRSANHHTTKIDLPYDAFNLEVKTPVDDNATRYFPLKRSLNGKYILGRTFLQESYLIVDYERGNFTIAPAAYNDPMPDSIIVPIKDFKRYPVRPVLTRRASFKDKGISAGAIAGLVVGLIAVVIITALGIRFWQKRRLANRKARSYTETMIMGTAVVGNEVKHRRISEFDSQSYAIGGSYGNDRDSKALELVSPINEMDNPPTEPYYSPASYSEDLDCFSASTKYERRTSERRSFAQNTPYEHKAKKELITGKDNVGHPHYIGSPKKQDTLTKTYPDIESLLKGLRENGDISNESSVSLRFDCELEAIVGSLKIQQCADIKAAISNALCNHVVIISSDQSTRGTRIEAVTCIAFAKRRWGLLGEQLLKFISRLCAEGHQEYGKRLLCAIGNEDQPELTYTMRLYKGILRVGFREDVSLDRLKEFANALSWLCRALRSPRPRDSSHGHFLSTSTCHNISPIPELKSARDTEMTSPKICIKFGLLSEPYHGAETSCWQKLFKSCYVLKEETIEDLDSPGKGIEVPFDMMTSLAAIEYPVLVNGGTVLAGYHTVLFPTHLEPTYVQFHLEVSENGQINPFEIDYAQRVHVTDYARFKNLRCFLGWCSPAHIQLGTKDLPVTVTYSDTKEKEKTLHRSGLSKGFQITSASPIQAGINGQISYSFRSHRLRFHPSSDYVKMLLDTSKDVVLVADVHARRSWLLPKLSVMLHMAHAWVAHMDPSPDADPIPFVEPHDGQRRVVEPLLGQGDIVVCGMDSDSFTLRRLLIGLSMNLLASVDRKAKSKKKTLYGFEFMDLVLEPGRGGFMKEFKISTSQSWLALANHADAVILCSNLGEAITPAYDERRKSGICNVVPCGKDYLAAHMTCLERLSARAGSAIISNNIGPITLSSHISWEPSGNPYEACNHNCDSTDTCWVRLTKLQNLDRRRVFSLYFGRWSTALSFSWRPIDTRGAVVFGKFSSKVGVAL